MTVRVTTGETKFHVLFTGDSKAISSLEAVLSKVKVKTSSCSIPTTPRTDGH